MPCITPAIFKPRSLDPPIIRKCHLPSFNALDISTVLRCLDKIGAYLPAPAIVRSKKSCAQCVTHITAPHDLAEIENSRLCACFQVVFFIWRFASTNFENCTSNYSGQIAYQTGAVIAHHKPCTCRNPHNFPMLSLTKLNQHMPVRLQQPGGI